MALIIPRSYRHKLLPETTEQAIKLIKDTFEKCLARDLCLRRVTAPLFVLAGTGLNDDLNGVEHAVSFPVRSCGGQTAEIVHSLAKWKRTKLAAYGIAPGYGLYTDMNAIRADEELDNLHSLYVDQWDWEKTITPDDRNVGYLTSTVEKIYGAIKETEAAVYKLHNHITPSLPDKITFVDAEDLRMEFPQASAKEREAYAARRHGAVFIIGIGGNLGDGKPHDLRAPDYDDWSTEYRPGRYGLNGDIVVWNHVLGCPFELSSMGIRVDPDTMLRQLEIRSCLGRASLPFHRSLIEGQLPPSIGGGIGQSRLCMLLLQKAHIGEVQASIWPAEQLDALRQAGIELM